MIVSEFSAFLMKWYLYKSQWIKFFEIIKKSREELNGLTICSIELNNSLSSNAVCSWFFYFEILAFENQINNFALLGMLKITERMLRLLRIETQWRNSRIFLFLQRNRSVFLESAWVSSIKAWSSNPAAFCVRFWRVEEKFAFFADATQNKPFLVVLDCGIMPPGNWSTEEDEFVVHLFFARPK